MTFIHYDEAKRAAFEAVRDWVQNEPKVERALLVSDLFGKFRLVLWGPSDSVEASKQTLQPKLEDGCGHWWTGEILLASEAGDAHKTIWDTAWNQARLHSDEPRFGTLDRHRTRTAWFADADDPLWLSPGNGPPIIVFYSFKGGLGRSTTLASFAIQRARAGERVCVIDFDLDSPGIGCVLSADDKGLTSPWGVVDYLLERAQGDVPISDYHHTCARVAGPGVIAVFPAGTLDAEYADKLARVDLEEPPSAHASGLAHLLNDIRTAMNPDWILLDARTGISELAGQLLSGLAHLHVLLGTTSEQSWQGLKLVLDRLGRDRVVKDKPQSDILLVQAMVPPTAETAHRATGAFAERARHEFTEWYYAMETDPAEDTFWDVRDLDSADAPHVPIALPYEPRLADFRDIAEIADYLCEREYAAIAERIGSHFEQEPQ